MTWWTELPHAARELIQMLGMFFGAVFLVCGAAAATEWWQRRRRR